MHEDIDDYEPDMEAYYRMDPEERQLRTQKYYWYKKYADGKISYDKYIRGLEGFYEVLDSEEWDEIKKYKENQLAKAKLEEQRKAARKEEFNRTIGHIVLFILLFGSLVVMMLSSLG